MMINLWCTCWCVLCHGVQYTCTCVSVGDTASTEWLGWSEAISVPLYQTLPRWAWRTVCLRYLHRCTETLGQATQSFEISKVCKTFLWHPTSIVWLHFAGVTVYWSVLSANHWNQSLKSLSTLLAMSCSYWMYHVNPNSKRASEVSSGRLVLRGRPYPLSSP